MLILLVVLIVVFSALQWGVEGIRPGITSRVYGYIWAKYKWLALIGTKKKLVNKPPTERQGLQPLSFPYANEQSMQVEAVQPLTFSYVKSAAENDALESKSEGLLSEGPIKEPAKLASIRIKRKKRGAK